MAPTAAQRAAAEEMRLEGNKLFQRGKYAAAADRYTEAIALAPAAPLYVNRALCARKLAAGSGDGGGAGASRSAAAVAAAWARVEEDSGRALELDNLNLKAHYLHGLALRERGSNLRKAISHLWRALEEARAKDDAIKDEIWRELAKAQDAAWQAAAAARQREASLLRDQLRALAAAAGAPPPPDAPPGAAPGPEAERNRDRDGDEYMQTAGSADLAGGGGPACGAAAANGSGSGGPALDWAALDRLLERAARADAPGEVPQAFCCPLTYGVYRDPVVSKSGHTYERAVLVEHLTKVGAWDPLTRAPCTVDDVRPNVAMRNAVQLYLEEHGWAWRECY